MHHYQRQINEVWWVIL